MKELTHEIKMHRLLNLKDVFQVLRIQRQFQDVYKWQRLRVQTRITWLITNNM